MSIDDDRGRQLAWVAALAAIAASAGDLLLLWDAGGGDRTWLPAGHYLGVLFIPLYAAGYWSVSRLLNIPLIFQVGIYASAIGAAIHGMTALAISAAPANGSAGDRFAALAPVLWYLIPLWLLLAVLTAVGSALQFRGVRQESRYPAWFAWTNPLALIVAIAAFSAPFPALASYIIPAAPNLAHILYFAITASLPRHSAAGSDAVRRRERSGKL